MTFFDNAQYSNAKSATGSPKIKNKRGQNGNSSSIRTAATDDDVILSPGSKEKFFVSFLQNNSSPEIRNSNVIHNILQSKEAQYCDFEKLTVFCGTYNVNGQACNNSNLKAWLCSTPSVGKDAPDIYAIGFQELDLSQQAFIFDSTPREHEWAFSVKNSLPDKVVYRELKRVRLIGMFLLIYVKKELCTFIDHASVEANTIGTGLLNRMGNKGAVAIRFKLHDSRFCFVSSHLAAGSDELMRRNQDFREICKMEFFQYNPNLDRIDIFDHDFVFWLGDLNYRLQDPLTGANLDVIYVKKQLEAKKFDELLKCDQLSEMRIKNVAFNEFKEGIINFLPTYKYDPGTDNWDSSEKCRVPAWTDRILWMGDNVEQLTYASAPSLKISDHKPVFSIFHVQVKRVNEQRFKKIYESALREADRLENEYLPQATVDKTEFRFNDVKFFEPQSQNFTITNTGQVPVQYNFKQKSSDNKSYCKPWLLITPDTFIIKVGEKCVVTITVTVDKISVTNLNDGLERLEDILVLHLEGGKDFFLTVAGNFVPTCFGRRLSQLAADRQSGGIKRTPSNVPVGQLIDLGEDVLDSTLSTFEPNFPGVPKELCKLVEHLRKSGLDTPDLASLPGSQSDFLKIRDALDSGTPEVLPGSIQSIFETLMRFLDTLPEPIVPDLYLERCFRLCNEWHACKKLIQEIPEQNRSVFLYIIDFLRDLKDHGHKNGCSTNSLASLFAPFLLRYNEHRFSPNFPLKESQKTESAIQFVTNFILNDEK